MFNASFYPTPKHLSDKLLEGFVPQGIILEPSAGKGDLADAIAAKGKQSAYNDTYQIDTVESESDLQSILESKHYTVKSNDFLTYQTFTEYQSIIMNPPFENGDQHLLKAIELAHSQVDCVCEIRAILNAETLKNPCSNSRKHLTTLLNDYQASITYHSNQFSTAERSSKVEIAIVIVTIYHTTKKISQDFKAIINTLFKQTEQTESLTTELSLHYSNQDVSEKLAEIDHLIQQYDYQVSLIKECYRSHYAYKEFERLINQQNEAFPSFDTYHSSGFNHDINLTLKNLRTHYWEAILATKDFSDRLTNHGRSQLMSYMADAGSVEVNYSNVQLLFLAFQQNAEQLMLDSCTDRFLTLTKHHLSSYSKNIHYYSGWKTNDSYKINKKIIYPIKYGPFYSWHLSDDFENLEYTVKSFIQDLVKMLQLIDPTVSSHFDSLGNYDFDNGSIRFKVFLKGTIHIWFKDDVLLETFNLLCAKEFNWLPTDDDIQTNNHARELMIKEFPHYAKQLNLTA